jgi:hypothetical protein
LEASSNRLTDVQESIKILQDKLNIVQDKLNSNTFNLGETKDFLITDKTYLNSELIKLDETKNNSIKELQDISNKSDMFSYLNDLLDIYRNFTYQLDLPQLVALVNIIGYVTILSTLFSITILLIGDYLIDKLKLEIKYPKLARFIRLKQTLNKGYLIFYLTFLYIISVAFIIGNIYMLLF